MCAGAAVELVHMATLVHDDLLDGATMRRGRPTVAQALGAARAVSTGDFLFARAFGELTRDRLAARGALAGRGRARPVAGRDGPAARRLRLRPHRGRLPLALPAQDGRALLGGLPAGRDGRRCRPRGRGPPGRLRRERRHGLPDLRRHPRPGGRPLGHRQAARHRPLRRHRDPPGDPRAAGGARAARRRRRRRAGAGPRGALRPARRPRGPADRPGPRARASSPPPAARSRRGPPTAPTCRPCSRSPTGWWTATRDRSDRGRNGGAHLPRDHRGAAARPRPAGRRARGGRHARRHPRRGDPRGGGRGSSARRRRGGRPRGATGPRTPPGAPARPPSPTGPGTIRPPSPSGSGRSPGWRGRPACCGPCARCRPRARPSGPDRGASRT